MLEKTKNKLEAKKRPTWVGYFPRKQKLKNKYDRKKLKDEIRKDF